MNNVETSPQKRLKHACWQCWEKFVCMTTYISPKLNTILRYKMVYHTFPNLSQPQTFSEKLCWLKLNKYMNNPLVIQCADKYRVRNYISEKGYNRILNELYQVFDSPDQIELSLLPEKFVLKWNFGAGKNLICIDKNQLNQDEIREQFRKWGKDKCWIPYSELQYKYIPPKIICEKYLQDTDHQNALPDYKVYCFHGEPRAILVILDRDSKIKAEFFDCAWNELDFSKYDQPEEEVKKPVCLQQMLDCSRDLSAPFPFVRVDFYIVNGQLVFGELTFTPAGGLYMSQTKIHGKDMTEYLQIPDASNIR